MRAHGAPEPAISAARRRWEKELPAFEPTEVYPENVRAFEVFVALGSQWEFPGPHGGRTTVPFPAIESCIRMMRLPNPPDVFRRVRTMISAAREVYVDKQRAEVARERIQAGNHRRR